MKLKTGDEIEIVSTGNPQETKIIVNGQDIADQVEVVSITMAPQITAVTLKMALWNGRPINVRGYVVSKKDIAAFRQWRAERAVGQSTPKKA